MQLSAVSPQYWNDFKQNSACPTALKNHIIVMLKKKNQQTKSQKYDH